MPKHPSLRRVMVIGSGPIIIGQAAEFDYSGTQACRALKEEGLEVILQNSNPATIMTDRGIADRVYLEPLTVDHAARIIHRERPDGLLPTLGGQVGLNLARELQENGVLDRYGVRLLGTPIEAIVRAEDREQFKETMKSIGEPVPESTITRSVEAGLAFASDIGYPVIVRPAYTLGGSGGGLASDPGELGVLLARGLKQSPIEQVLLERSVAGYKEIEYEVMRDGEGTFVTICDMENIDPMGVHTGDSAVVAPCQTLSGAELRMLRRAAVRIIEVLGIEGGCNIQFALDPGGDDYHVIEVNPRVSRSSALASKATGYPIAKVAAKIAVGLSLDEIENPVTGAPFGDTEPSLDYIVLKIPRWPFDKFPFADRYLGTQMKATGEVMAIERSFTAALLKALRSLDLGWEGLERSGLASLDVPELLETAARADDRRLFSLAECLRRGVSIEDLAERTMIAPFFLQQIALVVEDQAGLQAVSDGGDGIRPRDLRHLKRRGFSDETIARTLGLPGKDIRSMRERWGIQPVYNMVDSCAGELEAVSSYYYSTYEGEDEVEVTGTGRVAVLGSGPIRIGQGVEFDYCSVHALEAVRDAGLTSIMINNNPETVSTDFDVSDRLYFEPLVAEDVLNVLEREDVTGVITQFGGQTAINLTDDIHEAGFRVLGTSPDAIDMAEDRDRFYRFLTRIGVSQPPGRTVTTVEDALKAASELDYPLVLRPSYVLGGRAMEIIASGDELRTYLDSAVSVSPDHPVLVDKYLQGPEFEVDAISDGETVIVPGVMEHIEWAGVHSGDSIAVYPTRGATPKQVDEMVDTTVRICREMPAVGLVNVQFVLHADRLHVLEVNPRSSRTVPFLTKMTGVPMVRLATAALLGEMLADHGYDSGLCPWKGAYGVKVPVFSWAKMDGVDTFLGPEMKSTGEVMGMASSFTEALHKGLLAAGFLLPERGTLLVTVADRDKERAAPMVRTFAERGWRVLATAGTGAFLAEGGVPVERVSKLSETDSGYPGIGGLIRDGSVDLIVNTITRGRRPEREGFRIRRMAADMGVVCLTKLDTARAVAEVLGSGEEASGAVVALQDYE